MPFLVVTQVHPVWLNRKLQNLLCSLTILMESHMELCSEINGWSITQKNWFLAVKLRGPAWLVYTDLPEAKKHSYPELVRALQERFCPQGQVGLFRAQLRARGRSLNCIHICEYICQKLCFSTKKNSIFLGVLGKGTVN